jgi:hypothetical protein
MSPQLVAASVPEIARLISSLYERHRDKQARAGIAEMARTFDVGGPRGHFEQLMLDSSVETRQS